VNEDLLDVPRTLPVVRCDLHVHSRHSGPATVPVVGRLAQESYSEPEEVYAVARRRGMDLVTLTDHDSIAGALALAGRPDTFVSEEVTVEIEGRELHLGVFDLTEHQHIHVQARRRDPEALFAYLAEQRLPACVNHPFSALTGARETEDLSRAFAAIRLVETRNGMLSARCNDAAARAARSERRAGCGGSDAHTLASVARAYTCVAGRGREDFLLGLRRAHTFPAGRSGSYARLTADVVRIFASAWSDHLARARRGEGWRRSAITQALLPFAPLVPLVTAYTYLQDQLFAALHARRHAAAHRGIGRWRPGAAAGTAA
jgi:predicted metal-dependent phosphoesterase TrpH